MLAALLIAAGAAAHATWNIILKHSRASGTAFVTLTIIVGIIALGPLGAPALVASVRDTRAVGLLVVGGFLHVSYFLLLQRAYRVADVSVVYPVARGVGPLLSILIAIVILGERPTPIAGLGGMLVVAGVVLIGVMGSRPLRRQPRESGAVVAVSPGLSRRTRGALLGSAVGVLIAAYTIVDAVAVTRLSVDPLGYFWGSLVVQLIIVLVATRARFVDLTSAARAHPVAVVLVGILSPLAYVLILMAYQFAPVAIVAPAREASVVLVVLAGWLIFRESHPAGRLAASAVVLAGVALLSAG
jgi:drug/metabolite transporter (DMT)-like permease